MSMFNIIVFFYAVNPCGLEPCKNGAKCFNDDDTFRCVCTAEFMGRTCVERECLEHYDT